MLQLYSRTSAGQILNQLIASVLTLLTFFYYQLTLTTPPHTPSPGPAINDVLKRSRQTIRCLVGSFSSSTFSPEEYLITTMVPNVSTRLACLYTCPKACLTICLSACLAVCLPVCLHDSLHACQPAHLPACLPGRLSSCLPACL